VSAVGSARIRTREITPTPQRNHRTLTPELVREIRAAYAKGNVAIEALSKYYNVGTSTIFRVVTRRLWRDIP